MAKSTAQAHIVHWFKQLGLKRMAQQAALLVDEYETGRVNSSSYRNEIPFEN